MDEDQEINRDDDQPVLNFALVLQMDHLGRMKIESQNQGIPDALVILYAETWLEHVKDAVKKPIRDSLVGFGNAPPQPPNRGDED